MKFGYSNGFRSACVIKDKYTFPLCPELFGFEPELVISNYIQIQLSMSTIMMIISNQKYLPKGYLTYFKEELKGKELPLRGLNLLSAITTNCRNRSILPYTLQIDRSMGPNQMLFDFMHTIRNKTQVRDQERKDYGYILEKILERWWDLGFFPENSKSIVCADVYFVQNCRKFCILLMHIRKTKSTFLNRLPKDLIQYMAKILWETKFNILLWS